MRSLRLSAPASPARLVRRILDLFRVRLPDQRFARHRLSGGGFSFDLSLLSRGTHPLSRAPALGLLVDLLFNRRAVAHLGPMAFSELFSLPDQLGMAGSFERAYRCDA